MFIGLSHYVQDCQWPPTFSGYLKLKYFWFIFVCLNWIWIVLPTIVIAKAYYQLEEMIIKNKNNNNENKQKNNEKKKIKNKKNN